MIVGAGPAGCAAAYDLAACGRRVLLVDRAEFPRSKACAGALTMKAVRALRYSIDPVVRRWERSIVLEEAAGGAVAVGRRSPVCAMTVRAELDSYCLEQTRARGAVFARVGALAALEQQADRVVLRMADGGRLEARFLLGADGVHSRVRALLPSADGGAGWFRTGFALEANVPYRTAGERYPLTFDFAPVARGYGWLFPRDNHVNVGLYVEGGEHIDRAALERYIALRCGAGRSSSRPVGQFLGLGAAGYRPSTETPETRVLLAGDAAGFVDPLTGEGIYGAIRSGQAAAAAMHAALGGAAEGARGLWNKSRGREPLRPGLPVAEGFALAAAALQADLRVAEHAATRFFREPARGFRLMRMPLVPRAVLHAYSEGLSLGALLRVVRVAGRLRGR